MKETILIFGASNFGRMVYEKIKDTYNVIGFCDNDSLKWNTSIFGKPVYSISELLKLNEKLEFRILIASIYRIEIMHQLSSLGINFVYSSFINNIHNPLTNETTIEISIRKYNISNFSTLKIIQNRIGLIVRNHSGSNTFALWKSIPDYISEKFDVILIYDNEDEIENYKKMYTCKILITTHTNNLDFFKDDNERIYIQLWHGPPMKGVGRLDKTIPKDKKTSQYKWGKFDKITSYSNFYTTLLSACFSGDISKFEITGSPRNDYLYTSQGKEILSKLVPIDLSNKKMVFYMPTFRFNKYHNFVGGNKNWNNIFGFQKFKQKEFSNFLALNDIVLFIKMHPYEENYVRDLLEKYETENIFLYEENLSSGTDFYEILNACDLLITDYSSVYFDYLLLDRPIIFTPVDLKEYEENAGFLYDPYELWTPGDKVYNQKELQDKILSNLNNLSRYKSERDRIRRIFHKYTDSDSTERVWKLIEHTYNMNKELITY